ncbi:MAG: DUF1592 domain-containing protein, partial [Bdellovibrionales bacterium]|nr:DUF1592 domain-containing protein [Bdellovibrionales bacterium]
MTKLFQIKEMTSGGWFLLALSLLQISIVSCSPSPFRSDKSLTEASLKENTYYGSGECTPNAPLAQAQLHRLSNKEYIYVIQDLFGVALSAGMFPNPDKKGLSGFSNDITNFSTESALADQNIEAYFLLAAEVADKIMTENPQSVKSLGCGQNTEACFGEIVGNLALRLFRRPLGTLKGDTAPATYIELIKSRGADINEGLKLTLTSMLASPNFLYRTYGSFATPTNGQTDLTNFEIASRLAFFLWSSAPDPELLSSNLKIEAVLNSQISRMLQDARAQRLSQVFGNEWTSYADIMELELPAEFGVKQSLRPSAMEESKQFLHYIFTEGPRLMDLFDANYSFLNDQLADFYQVSGVQGENFRRVDNLGEQRGGMLTQMSILSVTNGPDLDTHPVRRGVWVVNEAMCLEIPDPPEGVD